MNAPKDDVAAAREGPHGAVRPARRGKLGVFCPSIQGKVFGVIFALTTALVVVLATYFPARHLASVQRAMESKAAMYGRLLARGAEPAVAFGDRQTARELFDATAQDADVHAMALFDEAGHALHVSGEPLSLAAPKGITRMGTEVLPGLIRVTTPVVSKEGPRGVVVVELGTETIEAERVQIRRTAIGVGLIALCAGFVAAWQFSRSLAKRLAAVTHATRAVAAGDLEQPPLGDASADEVGQLARGFNAMAANIKALVAQNLLAAATEKGRLDGLVTARTAQLDARNKDMQLVLANVGQGFFTVTRGGAISHERSVVADSLLGALPEGATFTDWIGSVDASAGSSVQLGWNALGAGLVPIEAALAQLPKTARRGQTHLGLAYSPIMADGELERVLVVVSDTTSEVARQRIEAELRLAQKLESVGRLAAGIAHEINTPIQFVGDSLHFVKEATTDLAGLLGRYQELSQSVGDPVAFAAGRAELNEAEAELDLPYVLENMPKALDRAMEGLARVTTIVRSMRDFAHPDEGKEMSSVDLNRAIESTITIACNEYKYVADVETDFGEIGPVTCYLGDVNQAVLNLIVNASHAIADVVKNNGGDRGKITVKTREEGDEVVITIRDTGTGIPKDIRDRIFDPFFTTKELGKGTGQGLAMVRAVIVDKHGGGVAVESELGLGTAFHLRLPIHGRRVRASQAA